MRGLGQRETSRDTYVGFSKGVFIKRVEQPTADTITRALTMGPKCGERGSPSYIFKRLRVN